jgi:hypothetical protein
MTRCLLPLVVIAIVMSARVIAEQSPVSPGTKPRILVHVTNGPEHATRAALAFLVARTAVEQGHAVSIFLAGDAVQLLRDQTLDVVAGVGTGRLREHYDAIVKGGGPDLEESVPNRCLIGGCL